MNIKHILGATLVLGTTLGFASADATLEQREQVASSFVWSDNSTDNTYDIELCGSSLTGFHTCIDMYYSFTDLNSEALRPYLIWLNDVVFKSSGFYRNLFIRDSKRAISRDEIKIVLGKKFLNDLVSIPETQLRELYPFKYREVISFINQWGNIGFFKKVSEAVTSSGNELILDDDFLNIDMVNRKKVTLSEIVNKSDLSSLASIIKTSACNQVKDAIAKSGMRCFQGEDYSTMLVNPGFFIQNQEIQVYAGYHFKKEVRAKFLIRVPYSELQPIIKPYYQQQFMAALK